MNMAKSPNPKSNAAKLVHQTAGMRIIVMSTRGELLRTSAQIHSRKSGTVATKRERVLGLVQPHVGPSESASRPVRSHPDRKRAPGTFMVPPARTGDSGTRITVAIVAVTVMIKGNQKSQ